MKRALLVLALVIAGLGALALRVVVEGNRSLAAGDAAMTRGDIDDAIASWESAARWYLPLAPHVDDAYARLRALGRGESDGAAIGHRHALAAWRAVRSAALASRGLWSPHADDLRAANEAIAEFASRDPEGALAGGIDAAARKRWHTERLAATPGPSRHAAVGAALGIAGFLVGVGLLLRRRGPDLVGVGVTVLGTVGWIVSLAVI